ncbi:MAG: FG-GAP repeat protein [Microcystaceae cyanobacterium]
MFKRSYALVCLLGLSLGLSSIPAAFAFEFDKKLLAPDGTDFDSFAVSVSLDNDTALVGSFGDDDQGNDSGSAYLFDATTGNLLQKLTAPDGAANDTFGNAVSLDKDTALVGSVFDDDQGNDSGSAYLFDATTGNLLQKLIAPDGAVGDQFGYSVSLDNDLALVGSVLDNDNGSGSGSAYLFDITTGNFLQKLTAPDGAAGEQFGFSVSLSGDSALVGSIFDNNNGSLSGAAYLFDVTTGNFLQKLTAPDGENFDLFGNSVSLSGDSALVGSRLDNDKGTNSGSAYIFQNRVTATTPEPSMMLGLLGVGSMALFTIRSKHK